MKIEQNLLVERLLKLTEEALISVKGLKDLPPEKLNQKAHADKWSVLECIEHLNLYGNFYLPEIERRLLLAPDQAPQYFKSSIIGDYFVRQVSVQNTNKIKATKQMDSSGSTVSLKTIDQFIKQLERLRSLLQASKQVDLNRTKTNISLTKLVRLRLGDTLRFLVYHNQRHIKQAERLIATQP